jgi:hypothetical protein
MALKVFQSSFKTILGVALHLALAGCGWVLSDDGNGLDSNPNSVNQQLSRKLKTYSVGGDITGLATGSTLVLSLTAEPGEPGHAPQRKTAISSNGSFSLGQMRAGMSYVATIKTQPAGQICTLDDPFGTIIDDTQSIGVRCIAERYKLTGSITGNLGSLSIINNSTGEQLVIAAGINTFAFNQPLTDGDTFQVAIVAINNGQTCFINNGNGRATSDMKNPQVTCAAVPVAVPSVPQGLSVSYAAKSYGFSWSASTAAVSYELAQDPDGTGPLPETILANGIASTNYNHAIDVLLHQRLNAQYRVRACNAGGCSAYSNPIQPDISKAIGYFKASNPRANAQFGFFSMALSADGSTLAVGSLEETSNGVGVGATQNDSSAPSAGAVYVYTKSAGVWSQQAYVKPSNTSTKQYFGVSVALSSDGNTLAVGASGEASNATGIEGNQNDKSAPDAGAVYLFARNQSAWQQTSYLKASNARANSGFGVHVSLSADAATLAVGAWTESSNAKGIDGDQTNTASANSGAVYLFTFTAGAWSQQAYIKASNTLPEHRFGQRVVLAANGNTLAVGAIRESSNATGVNGNQSNASSSEAGAVYVFVRSAGSWQQQAYIKSSNTNATNVGVGDRFSVAISIAADGNTLAVGAWGEDSAGRGVGSNQNDESSLDSGAVYVFIRNAGVWSQQAYIKASNARAGDRFGVRLALSADADTLAVGAYAEDSTTVGIGGDQTNNGALDSGAVYLFSRQLSGWTQKSYLKSSNSKPGDGFGWGIAISADGKTLAVGAPGESSGAAGVAANPNDTSAPLSGAVYLY